MSTVYIFDISVFFFRTYHFNSYKQKTRDDILALFLHNFLVLNNFYKQIRCLFSFLQHVNTKVNSLP